MSELLLRRRALMMAQKKSRLPSEYQEVKYLEGTGTQYIDTGVQKNVEIDFVFSLRAIQNTAAYNGFGAASRGKTLLWGTYPNPQPQFTSVSTDTWNVDTVARSNVPCDLETHRFIIRNGKQMLDDMVYGEYTYSDTTYSRPLLLFASSVGWDVSPQYFVKERVFSCEFSRDNVLIRNFIPCYRKADHKPGMYDLVTKTFFTNAGTGEFIVGADVN